ncbi:hypothetical protein CDAR_253261 [Caerostris darwini]|uniref:Uncharacterized protein n=1 Tax=Caerostris darwini TaxID=1538125 RepID=A0AAV4RIV0_9ARAC|nr:hypothetical protein CDAR_253261 [Caerostris darwini]
MVFPTDVSSSVPQLRHPAKGEWGCLLRKVIPFMLRLRADRVLMFWMLPNEMFGKMIDNFYRTTKEAVSRANSSRKKFILTNSTTDTASWCRPKKIPMRV